MHTPVRNVIYAHKNTTEFPATIFTNLAYSYFIDIISLKSDRKYR